MAKIHGKDITLYVITNASPEVRQIIGCARTCTLTTVANTAGKSTIGSGIWQEFIALSMSWTASVDGLCTVDQNMGIDELRAYQFALTPIYMRFIAGASEYYGAAIIQSVQETGTYSDAENYSVQLQGTGALTQIYYGNYPLLFQIINVQPNVPVAGKTTLSFVWNPAIPTPLTYTVRETDTTTNVTTIIPNIPEAGHTVDIIVDGTHSYTFAIKSVYSQGSSIYSPLITWP